MGKIWREYGVASRVYFELWTVDGEELYTTALASGDVTIAIDGGTPATLAVTALNSGYYADLSIAQLTGEQIQIKMVDQTATKEFLDDSINIETYGDPSALHQIPLASDISSVTDVTDAIEALTTADADTWAEVMTFIGAFVANNITATGVRDRGNTKDRITASRTATTRTVTARDAT